MEVHASAGQRELGATMGEQAGHGGQGATLKSGEPPEEDPSLEHPRCVFQLLRRHYRRYTPEFVEQVCGVPQDEFIALCDSLCANSGRDRTTAFVYSVGWTQHTVGVQYIRTAAIIQLLLGNIGRPGGGIMALRGHASIQGSTDIPTLYNILPGYLPMPHVGPHPDLASYIELNAAPSGFWGNMSAYAVSLLKAYWGDVATPANDFCFDFLPRISGDHGTYQTALDMCDGKVPGFIVVGENPAVGSANGPLQRRALAEAKWLVVRDLVEIETASFWYDSPEVRSGELETSEIATEVFLLPAASHVEKEGSFTNTQRLLQWHRKAIEPEGDCRSDLWFYFHLGRLIREKLAARRRTDDRDRPVLELTWNYPVTASTTSRPPRPSCARSTAGEPTARSPRTPSSRTTARQRAAAGSTAVATPMRRIRPIGARAATSRRGSRPSGVGPGRRTGASSITGPPRTPKACPGPSASAMSGGMPSRRSGQARTSPTSRSTSVPTTDRPRARRPRTRSPGNHPFIMQADGRGWLFAPAGVVDGPFPTHYEPHESPFANALYSQRSNPARQQFPRRGNRYQPSNGEPGASEFPFVFTTYRLTEHHTAGGMSRSLPYLAELQPEMFCEVSPELAIERGLEHGGWATITTLRAAIEARVMVSGRMRPVMVQGRPLHQVGLPYHWGSHGLTTGRLGQ